MPTLREFLLTLLLAAAWPAAAQAPPSLDAVLARYLDAKSYCEEGKRSLPGRPDARFSVCADASGRFKHVDHLGEPEETVQWTQGALVHSWRKDGRVYQEHRRDTVEGRSKGYALGRPPAARSRLLDRSLISPGALDGPDPFRGYEFSPALSSATHAVFERRPPYGQLTERLWVRHPDGVLVRHEHIDAQGVRQHLTELTSVRLDAPLSEADLSLRVGFIARHAPQEQPLVVLAGVLLLWTGAAVLAWSLAYARLPADHIGHLRSRAWWWWWRVLIVAVAALASLTVLTLLSPGSGHPPAIVVPILLGWLAGILFAFSAAVLLASYPAEWWMRRRRRYAASL